MSDFLVIHAIQSLPPSNINRDDTGAPKSAVYGGVMRGRVSSQSWKRATRMAFADEIEPALRGVRTLRVVELLSSRISELSGVDTATAVGLATTVLKDAGIKVKEPRLKKGEEPDPGKFVSEALVFLSNQQVTRLAEVATADPYDPKVAKNAIDTDHGIDVALFGRMVASAPDLNVDASVQVAHAISTHEIDPQADFYTAVDDNKPADDDAGAGMMGVVEFSSSTLYRYAAIGLSQLNENIGDPALAAEAAAAFVKAFLLSLPSGKKNSLAADTIPSAVLVELRRSRPTSLVGAFETPVKRGSEGFVNPSVEAMARHASAVNEALGDRPLRAWVFGVGEVGNLLDGLGNRVPLRELVTTVSEAVRTTLTADEAS